MVVHACVCFSFFLSLSLCVCVCVFCVCTYSHSSPSHASMNCKGTLARGANALHDDTQHSSPTVLWLADEAVFKIHLSVVEKVRQSNGWLFVSHNAITACRDKSLWQKPDRHLELSSLSRVGTSTSCLVTMPKEALTATESEPVMLKPTSFIRWFPSLPFRATSDLSS